MTTNKYSAHKIVNHPAKLQSFREGKIVAPLYVRIKPTNRCAHRCHFCTYSQTYSGGMHELAGNITAWRDMPANEIDEIPSNKLLEIIQDIGDMGVKAITFSGGGEPLQHPAIVDAARMALNLGIAYSAITNGQALNGSRADIFASAAWVRVSIDYANGKQMAESRGVPERFFDQIIENLTHFAKIKQPDCELTCNFIITEKNFKSVYDATVILKSCGICNIRFSPAWRPDFASFHAPMAGEVIRQIEQAKELQDEKFKVYSSYNLSDSQHGTKRPTKKCYFLQITPSIGADLGVYACHQTSYSKHGFLGSLKNARFKDVWFSEETKKLMEALDPTCVCNTHNCAQDAKNLLIHNILDAGDDHFV